MVWGSRSGSKLRSRYGSRLGDQGRGHDRWSQGRMSRSGIKVGVNVRGSRSDEGVKVMVEGQGLGVGSDDRSGLMGGEVVDK